MDPRRYEDARAKASEVPRAGRKQRLVEVGDVEVHKAVVAHVRAEVFDMKVAADPDGRRIVERGSVPVFAEEMAGSPKEPERALLHRLVLARKSLDVASAVEVRDPLKHIRA